jgi:sensor domain CHASE-containing protein
MFWKKVKIVILALLAGFVLANVGGWAVQVWSAQGQGPRLKPRLVSR